VFERFSESARQVVVLAHDEARLLKHNYIGTEHLLLGLLREKEEVAVRTLESVGVRIDDTREYVVRSVGKGDDATTGQIPFTPKAKKALEFAVTEARALREKRVSPEHVLLGILRGGGVATEILSARGAESEEVRFEILRALENGSGAAG
jgi:ATP-dependent Clp protease ATP-binding subunit ClpC